MVGFGPRPVADQVSSPGSGSWEQSSECRAQVNPTLVDIRESHRRMARERVIGIGSKLVVLCQDQSHLGSTSN